MLKARRVMSPCSADSARLRLSLPHVRGELDQFTGRCARDLRLHAREVSLPVNPVKIGAGDLGKRLRKRREHLLRSLDHEAVEATNNLAEREIRPAVVARKMSAGNRAAAGAETHGGPGEHPPDVPPSRPRYPGRAGRTATPGAGAPHPAGARTTRHRGLVLAELKHDDRGRVVGLRCPGADAGVPAREPQRPQAAAASGGSGPSWPMHGAGGRSRWRSVSRTGEPVGRSWLPPAPPTGTTRKPCAIPTSAPSTPSRTAPKRISPRRPPMRPCVPWTPSGSRPTATRRSGSMSAVSRPRSSAASSAIPSVLR